ncbi:MAG: SprT family zinc-dependent metalloprotease [Hyphomicrobiaceae bacterium]|nr:SprT family zinc-dependent metalloprotease [Hyphomicrobiaceae bacterium]
MRRRPTSATPDYEETLLEGLGAPVEIRHHPKARRLTLRVSRTRRAVVVTVPPKCNPDIAESFVARHIEWVRARLDSLPAQVPFADGAIIPLRGEPHRIVFVGARRGARPVSVIEKVGGTGEIIVTGPVDGAPRRLLDWLMAEAKRDLDTAVLFHARRVGVRAKRISVRDQASRWGSCSSTGALSFSWRLILAPAFVLDYVAAHEVAHLREMNHGPRFWALVRDTMPAMDAAKAWLAASGMDLHRFG